jgi:FlaA1/EpsC-like NDP-sugar epimerase
MGEPVPILELAKNLLRLSGQGTRVGRDIVITELRPGEKLHEELAAPDEKAIPTGIEKVTLLDTSVARLPAPIADAIEEERIEEVLAFLRAEIMVLEPEAHCSLDNEPAIARMAGSD